MVREGCLFGRVRVRKLNSMAERVRTIIQFHGPHPILVVIIVLLLDNYRGLRTTLLASALRAEGRALVGLEYDLLERLEFVGVVYVTNGDSSLLAMLEVVCAIRNILLGGAAHITHTALACGGGHNRGRREKVSGEYDRSVRNQSFVWFDLRTIAYLVTLRPRASTRAPLLRVLYHLCSLCSVQGFTLALKSLGSISGDM